LFKKRRWNTWKEDKRRTIEDGEKKKWKIAAMPSNKKVLGVFDSVISRKKSTKTKTKINIVNRLLEECTLYNTFKIDKKSKQNKKNLDAKEEEKRMYSFWSYHTFDQILQPRGLLEASCKRNDWRLQKTFFVMNSLSM